MLGKVLSRKQKYGTDPADTVCGFQNISKRFLSQVFQDNHLTIAKKNMWLEDRVNCQFSQQKEIARALQEPVLELQQISLISNLTRRVSSKIKLLDDKLILGNKDKGILKNCKVQESALLNGTWNWESENVKCSGGCPNSMYTRMSPTWADHYLSEKQSWWCEKLFYVNFSWMLITNKNQSMCLEHSYKKR